MTRSSHPPASSTVPARKPSLPSRCAGSSAPTGAPVSSANRAAPAEWSRCPWVSTICVTRRSPAVAASSTRRRWSSSSGPGSTTVTADEPGSAITQVLVPSSVIGDGLGASTHQARPVPMPLTAFPSAPGLISFTAGTPRHPGCVQPDLAVAGEDQARRYRLDRALLGQDARDVVAGRLGRREVVQRRRRRREQRDLARLGGGDGGRRAQPGDVVGLGRVSGRPAARQAGRRRRTARRTGATRLPA